MPNLQAYWLAVHRVTYSLEPRSLFHGIQHKQNSTLKIYIKPFPKTKKSRVFGRSMEVDTYVTQTNIS